VAWAVSKPLPPAQHTKEPRSNPGLFIYVVWLPQPEWFSGRKVDVEVETISPLTTGMTVIDWWSGSGRTKNAYVVRDIDVAGFYDTIFESFRRLP